MCGIVGVVGGVTDPDRFSEAVDRLRHRGPDDRGVERLAYSGGDVWLGFRRLAILDPSPRGHQPMFDARRELCIVYNGEVYNFRDLRRELSHKGHVFQSETDTEVLLAAYREWGPAAVERFVGMFALAIWDARHEALFLARDRLGVKPLYYWQGDGRFAFASELKSILAIDGVPRCLNEQAVGKFFTFLWVPDPETLLRGLYQLEPGHTASYQGGRLSARQYWDVPVGGPLPVDEARAVAGVEQLLLDSVRRRLISDVPLGAFLSGGIDSSLIVAMMRKAGVKRLTTQTIDVQRDDAQYDIAPADAPYARQVRDFVGGLDYHEILLRPSVIDLLPRLTWHMDDPVADPAAIATFLICRAAKEHSTVMLSGMGAEELFVGYRRHRAALIAELYARVPPWLRGLVSRGIVEHLPASRPWPLMSTVRNAKKFLANAGLPFERRYMGFLSYYSSAELPDLLSDGLAGTDVYAAHRAAFARASGADRVARMAYVDLKTFLPNLNLAYTDRASMAASVEVRVPMVDHQLVEFVARLPANLRLRGARQKYVLRKVAESYLPRDIVRRGKTGFGAPVRAWVTKDLRGFISDLLSKDRLRRRGVLRPETVWRIIEDGWRGREDNALRIWAFLTFELWAQTFLDRDGATAVS